MVSASSPKIVVFETPHMKNLGLSLMRTPSMKLSALSQKSRFFQTLPLGKPRFFLNANILIDRYWGKTRVSQSRAHNSLSRFVGQSICWLVHWKLIALIDLWRCSQLMSIGLVRLNSGASKINSRERERVYSTLNYRFTCCFGALGST